MASLINDRKRFRVRKLCLDDPEELLEYEVLRNKAMEGEIEILGEPKEVFDSKLSKYYFIIEWLE